MRIPTFPRQISQPPFFFPRNCFHDTSTNEVGGGGGNPEKKPWRGSVSRSRDPRRERERERAGFRKENRELEEVTSYAARDIRERETLHPGSSVRVLHLHGSRTRVSRGRNKRIWWKLASPSLEIEQPFVIVRRKRRVSSFLSPSFLAWNESVQVSKEQIYLFAFRARFHIYFSSPVEAIPEGKRFQVIG